MTGPQAVLLVSGLGLLLYAVAVARQAGRMPHGTMRSRRHRKSSTLAAVAAVMLATSSAIGFLS
jgi:hypothetical protein